MKLLFTFGPRQWRVRGIGKNLAFDTLRVQLRVLVQSGGQQSFHLDNLDLCNAKHRNSFIAQAHAETHMDEQLLKRDLAQVFLKVEELQEKCIREALEPKQKEVIVPDAERSAAMELLKDPKLLDRILADFDRCGVVGEQVNKLVGYLATVSRKLDEPLAVIIQSASAAGKSSLMEAILAFVPEEQRVKYSAMTGQSLYYLGDSDLSAQGAGHRGGGGRRAGQLRLEAAAKRRRVDHRLAPARTPTRAGWWPRSTTSRGR